MRTYLYIFCEAGSDKPWSDYHDEPWYDYQHAETPEEAWAKFLGDEYHKSGEDDIETLESFIKLYEEGYINELQETIIFEGIQIPITE
jgi:hypothetical protein